MRNRARAPRCSRAASDSPAPMIVGVTKSPCRAAACMTKPARNSSPTSGSNTTAVANNASAQSRMPVRPSTSSRVGCQIGSSCQVCLWIGAVEALDLLGQREVVEDQVLREAQLVRRADRHRVVDHVRRRVALGRRVDVHADAVLGVRPGEHVALEDLHPGGFEWAKTCAVGRARCSAGSGGRRPRCCDRSSAPTPRWGRGTRASWTTSAPSTPPGSRRRRWRRRRPSPGSGGARDRAGRRR